jgi:hypothetical protein
MSATVKILILAALGLIIYLGVLLWLMPLPAMAQSVCASERAIAKSLSDRYGETVMMVGTVKDGKSIKIFANAVTGTFTIMVESIKGNACFVATGKNLHPEIEGEPS